jgi:hypothetical protein
MINAESSATPSWNRETPRIPDVFRGSPFEYDTTIPLEQLRRPVVDSVRSPEAWDPFDLVTPPGLADLKLDLRLSDPQQLELHRES